jgi:alpha-L-arabinofuranosidase
MARDESSAFLTAVTGVTLGNSHYAPAIRRRARHKRFGSKVVMECLEPRTMLSVVTVDTSDTLRSVSTNVLGVNLVDWDSNMATTQTLQMVEAAGLSAFRFPNGDPDSFHFNDGPSWSTQPTAAEVASLITAVGGTGLMTVDYGSGSPQEAAAFMAYLDGSPTDTTVIGSGPEFDNGVWETTNWQTVGYWASLRAAAPLATDDGLNFLRADHAASFGINFFEVGNQAYQSSNGTDHHGSGGGPGVAYDPTTYANFVMTFAGLAHEIDPTALIGIDSAGPSGDWSNWLGQILTIFSSNNYTPGFISDQLYLQNPGTENDSFLLNDTTTSTGQTGGDPTDWVDRAADYETDLQTYLGATDAANVQLIETTVNDTSYNVGKQTTSLVSGLWLADSIGDILGTAWDGMYYTALRAYTNAGNEDPSLYGWRDFGDPGLIGIGGTAPESGVYVAYPDYFAEELAAKLAQTGGIVVGASSDNPLLDAYAVLEPNGHLDLMVINKDPNNNLTEQFQISGFTPSGASQEWTYGEAEDTAQSQTTDGASSLTFTTPSLTVTGNDFSSTFAKYSMTVIDLSPSAGPAPTTTVSVNAGQTIRETETQDLGVNLVQWDSLLNTTQTEQMVEAAGINTFRFPGGGISDSFHFNIGPAYNGQGTSASIASFIASVNGTGLVTLDYGSGSPQEAAAFLAYLNGSPTDTTVIGMGEEWDTTSNTWVSENWQTVGYWASLRASTPLATDDGLNFLRIDHPASIGIHYFEVGNEEYGSWETDEHGSGGDTGAPHDPATYANFVMQFAALAEEIDPTISIGIDAPGPSLSDYGGWLGSILTIFAAHNYTPGFLSDHMYPQNGGSESDSFLLNDTVSDTSQNAGDPTDWVQRSADYEADLTQFLGATDAANVELLDTELNSTLAPGKQTTSLVNGLWLADSIGSIMETDYDGQIFWDLRNSWQTTGNNSPSLYGWRQGGDYGMIGTSGSSPATGPYIAYPTYYAEELASKFDIAGGDVVQVTSGNASLDAYAVMEANGQLDLMIINKSSTSDLTAQFDVNGFIPNGQAEVWQYGEAQDNAQEASSNGASSLANFNTILSLSGVDFNYTFPAYSMTVLQLSASATLTVATAAAATPNPTTDTTTNLSVLGAQSGTDAGLTYTWTVTSAPAGVLNPAFSINGTNAAKNTTATFFGAGNYTFKVTIEDTLGVTTSSSVSMTVDQTAASLTVTPQSSFVGDNTSKQFSAIVDDQFGAVMTPAPTITWTLQAGSVGTITSGGSFSSIGVFGSATVIGTIGSISNSATVTVNNQAASVLVIGQQPGAAFVDGDISVVVDVENALGQIVTTDNSDVTLGILSGPAGGTLAGTVTVAAVHGVAIFSNVAVTGWGSYDFGATDGSLTGSALATVSVVTAPPIHFALSGIPLSPEARAFQERNLLDQASLSMLMTLVEFTPSAIPYAPIPISAFQQWVNEHANIVSAPAVVSSPFFFRGGPDLVAFNGSSGGGDTAPSNLLLGTQTNSLATPNDILN